MTGRRLRIRRGLLGAGLAAPLLAAAQRAEKPRRIGILIPVPQAGQHNLDVLYEGLRELGYVEGRNLAIERRYAEGREERLPGLMAELLKQDVELVVAAGPAATRAAHAATTTVPIVMGTFDPVEQGLVASLARPGGNLTGWCVLSAETLEKQLSMLKEAMPRLARIGVLATAGMTQYLLRAERVSATTRALGVHLKLAELADEASLEAAFAALRQDRVDAVVVMAEPPLDRMRERITGLATQHRLPSIYTWRFYADAGGLMTYGPNLRTMVGLWPAYVDKILKGARPADLPVQTPNKYELVLNQRTAREIGFTFPGPLLVAAEAVIS